MFPDASWYAAEGKNIMNGGRRRGKQGSQKVFFKKTGGGEDEESGRRSKMKGQKAAEVSGTITNSGGAGRR